MNMSMNMSNDYFVDFYWLPYLQCLQRSAVVVDNIADSRI